MGAVLAAEFIACTGDIRRFGSADALASAAGLAPVQRQSGKRSGWRRAYGGDKALKRVFYQSAFCAVTIGDPLSRAFYDRKRRRGKAPLPGPHRPRPPARHRSLDHASHPRSLRPNAKGCLTYPLRSCPPAARHFPYQSGQPVRPQPDFDAVSPHVDPLDQQLDDPRLLGREQLVPQRLELVQRLPRPRAR